MLRSAGIESTPRETVKVLEKNVLAKCYGGDNRKEALKAKSRKTNETIRLQKYLKSLPTNKLINELHIYEFPFVFSILLIVTALLVAR